MELQTLNLWIGDVLSRSQDEEELQKLKCITSKKEIVG
jgi:hypothetical protein